MTTPSSRPPNFIQICVVLYELLYRVLILKSVYVPVREETMAYLLVRLPVTQATSATGGKRGVYGYHVVMTDPTHRTTLHGTPNGRAYQIQ